MRDVRIPLKDLAAGPTPAVTANKERRSHVRLRYFKEAGWIAEDGGWVAPGPVPSPFRKDGFEIWRLTPCTNEEGVGL